MSFKILFKISILLIFINSCSPKNKFFIEKTDLIKFEKSYYQKWAAPIKGGGSGLNIHLFLESESELKENVELKGIYFRNKYSPLKRQTINYYQAFIRLDENWETYEDVFEDKQITKVEKKVLKKEDESFPFELKSNEAVISYQKHQKIKYIKIHLTEKENESTDIPM